MQRSMHIFVANYLHFPRLSPSVTAGCCPRVVNTRSAEVRDVG